MKRHFSVVLNKKKIQVVNCQVVVRVLYTIERSLACKMLNSPITESVHLAVCQKAAGGWRCTWCNTAVWSAAETFVSSSPASCRARRLSFLPSDLLLLLLLLCCCWWHHWLSGVDTGLIARRPGGNSRKWWSAHVSAVLSLIPGACRYVTLRRVDIAARQKPLTSVTQPHGRGVYLGGVWYVVHGVCPCLCVRFRH